MKSESIESFERFYFSEGTWVQLFRKSQKFERTILLKNSENPRRYMTLDVWKDQQSYERFKSEFEQQDRSIDGECEGFTELERYLGSFEMI